MTTRRGTLRDADAALLVAKSRGRNRVEVFDDAMRADAIAKLDLVNDLHRAVREQEFEIFYQPQVEFADAAVVGFEALIRWRHPTRGLLEPNDFIPRAEESGLIVPIGAWVIDEVCSQAARWKAVTPELEPLVVSVNLSACQLAASRSRRHGQPPRLRRRASLRHRWRSRSPSRC